MIFDLTNPAPRHIISIYNYYGENMEIREINQYDSREEISNIYEQSWRHAYKGIIPQDFLDSIPKGRWCRAFDNPKWHTLIMFDNGKMIGTSSYCASRFEKFNGMGEIISIYFLPEYCRKGYGKQLLMSAVDKLKAMGFEDVFLWVLEENHNARHFYEKCGFKFSGESYADNIGGKDLVELQYAYHIE